MRPIVDPKRGELINARVRAGARFVEARDRLAAAKTPAESERLAKLYLVADEAFRIAKLEEEAYEP